MMPAWWRTDPCAPFRIGPREFPGRIWTASGCFAYGLTGHEMTAPGYASPYEGLGAVVTKTITPEPRAGNPMPRLAETPAGALNSIGLENVGLREFVRDVMPRLEAAAVPFVASIAATCPEQFSDLARAVQTAGAKMRHWHGLELNLSCPNVAEGGHDFGKDPDTVAACVSAAGGGAGDRALLVKLTPNVGDIAALARAAAAAGAHAVSAVNTFVGLDVDLATGRPCLPRRFGGYSGAAILPLALAKVDEIVRKAQVPVVGVGGIGSADDALKYFALGAVAVQVGTAQMRDPFCAARIARQLQTG
ncbi:dihydroorotate dehydrogenase [bacterium]|nr:dihydroorotate dehydrogenase [bacterium]